MSDHEHDWASCDFGYDTDYEPPVQQCVRCAEYRHHPDAIDSLREVQHESL